jgi:hypothetical protein
VTDGVAGEFNAVAQAKLGQDILAVALNRLGLVFSNSPICSLV